MFQERKVKPRRADDSARWMMAALSRMFPWGNSLLNVKPDTLIRWQRRGFRLFWRWKSKPTGRPRLPKDLRKLIREMAAENPIWGEERIGNELKLKLGIRGSPRTVGKYLRDSPVRVPRLELRQWLSAPVMGEVAPVYARDSRGGAAEEPVRPCGALCAESMGSADALSGRRRSRDRQWRHRAGESGHCHWSRELDVFRQQQWRQHGRRVC
jgi:hypothetical protein